MKEWVFLFPGQGSQYVGMGKDFCESYVEVNNIFTEASDILGMDIKKLCFEGPEEELVLTKNVQPAITVVNIACAKVLQLHGIHPVAVAGHSLGEYSALYIAGVIDFKTLMTLVKYRALFMHEASEQVKGGMLAVMHAKEDQINELCQKFNLEIANINSPDQIILTGELENITKAMEESKRLGIRKSVMLNVSGAWHSRFMKPASQKFEAILKDCTFNPPLYPVVTNIDAKPLDEVDSIKEKLKDQICSPVLWKQSIEWLVQRGYKNFVEVGPKQVLSGLMRRINKDVNIEHVEDSISLLSFLRANQNNG